MAESPRPGPLPNRTATLLRPLGRSDRARLSPLIHAAVYALRWIGLRDRLRCPQCRAVGTFKPHGTVSARLIHKDRPVRRWMCKWCGLYIGPEGVMRVFPDPTRNCWVLPHPWDPESPEEPGPTPADVVAEALDRSWPWYG
jgi:hypothetical protein